MTSCSCLLSSLRVPNMFCVHFCLLVELEELCTTSVYPRVAWREMHLMTINVAKKCCVGVAIRNMVHIGRIADHILCLTPHQLYICS